MRCPLCNTENEDNATNCSRCGASLQGNLSVEDYASKSKPRKVSKGGLSVGGILLIVACVFGGRFLGHACGKAIGEELTGKKSTPSYSFDAEKAKEDAYAKIKETDEKLKSLKETSDAISNIDITSVAATDPDTASDDLSIGTITKDTYENESLGFGCKLEGWTYADKAQLAELNGMKNSLPDDVKELVEKNGFALVMWAMAPSADQTTINVQVQNTRQQFGVTITEEDYISALPEMLPEIKSTMEKSGFSNVSVSVKKVKTSDSEYDAIFSSAMNSGIKVYTKQIFIIRGDYAAIITAQSCNTDATDSVLKNIYKLD